MFRLWARIFQNTHMIKDYVYEDATPDTRTHKVFHGLTAACREFDLAEPLWLDLNVADFKRCAKTRFSQDSFIESIDFDYLEIQIIEED